MNTNIVIHWDSLEYMKSLPDKCIDLVLTDPPYGIWDKFKWWSSWKMNFNEVVEKWWDVVPTKEYFDEIFRISKNQIIWGWNYFSLPPTRCFIIWDKKISEDFSLAMCEMAYTSFDKLAKIYSQSTPKDWKMHPTQKPKELFKWCLESYSQPWDIILDCFAWSWTTAVACIELWRQYIVIEKEKDYIDVIEKRIRNTTPPLFI